MPSVIVIPVAAEDTNPTLPLAIASIREHTDYRIVTIGHDFGLCEHIPMAQNTRRPARWANTDNAMRLACEHFDTFIWSNDDIYWTRPVEPVRWALGHLADTTRKNAYGRRKQATHAWLRKHDLPTWDYEAHVPMPINAAAMLEALGIIATTPTLDKRSLYGNLTGQPDLIAPDVKVRTRETPSTPWLSSDGTGHLDAITQAIRG